MQNQLFLTDSGFERPPKHIRPEIFLSQLENSMPWKKLTRLTEPMYPKAGNGSQLYPLEQMLRIYCLQLWYNLSDPRADSTNEPAPDESMSFQIEIAHSDEGERVSLVGVSRLFTDKCKTA